MQLLTLPLASALLGLGHVGLDTPLSEMYRSAYLRTLAWAHQQGLPTQVVLLFAAHACPVDFALWRVTPQKRPPWWPQIAVAPEIDTSIADIWQQITAFWERLGNGPESKGTPDVLLAASGWITNKDTAYHLSLFSMFQRPLGPDAPDARVLIDSLEQPDEHWVAFAAPDLLQMQGMLQQKTAEDIRYQIEDWEIVPAVCEIRRQGAVPRWQWWMMDGGVWIPAPFLAQTPTRVRGHEGRLQVMQAQDVVGATQFWTDGIQEVVPLALPSNAGFTVMAARPIIDAWIDQSHTTFCCGCRLRLYPRETDQPTSRMLTFEQLYGATTIYRP